MALTGPSEKQFRALADQSPLPIAILDDERRFVYANAVMAKQLGKTPDELVGFIDRRVAMAGQQFPVALPSALPPTSTPKFVDRQASEDRDRMPITYQLMFFPLTAGSEEPSATGVIGLDVSIRDAAVRNLEISQRTAQIGTWYWQPKTGRFLGSHQMYALFDLDPALGPVEADRLRKLLVHRTDVEAIQRLLEGGFRERSSSRVDIEIRTEQTPSRWLRVISAPKSSPPEGLYGSVQDITEARSALEDVAVAQQRFRHAFEDGNIAMAITALDGRILTANPALLRLLGYSREELEHLSMNDILLSDDRKIRERIIREATSGEQDSFQLEAHVLRGDGVFMWIVRHVTVLRDPDGTARELLTQMIDATEHHKTEENLRRLADHDPLTNVLNRRGFDAVMANHADHDRRSRLDSCLLLIDLDQFKSVNDRYGHAAGDKVLITLTDIMRGLVRATDAIGRIGGDEFAVLLPETDLSGAHKVAEKLAIEAQERLRLTDVDPPRQVSISIGIASLSEAELAGLSLLEAADRAMYEAKCESGTRLAQFSSHEAEPGL